MGKINYQEETEVVAGKEYTFKVKSIEKHWKGYDSGKMEDAPGNFLKQSVSLVDIHNPNTLERLALEKGVGTLLENPREIEVTTEPKGYSKLKHEELVIDVKVNYQKYIAMIEPTLRERLRVG